MKKILLSIVILLMGTKFQAQSLMLSGNADGDFLGPDAYVIPTIVMSSGNGYFI